MNFKKATERVAGKSTNKYIDIFRSLKEMDLDFLKHAEIKIGERRTKKSTKELLELVGQYFKFYMIFRCRRNIYKVKFFSKIKSLSNADKKTISRFLKLDYILDIFSLEIYRLFQASVLLMISGYYVSALSLLRMIVERTIQSQFFMIDPSSFDDWEKGKWRKPMTGRNGIMAMLSDPNFIKTKIGAPIVPFIHVGHRRGLESLYKTSSEILHGKMLASRDVVAAIHHAKTDDELVQLLEKGELGYLEKFSEITKGILDQVTFLQLVSILILTNMEVLDITDGEENLQMILPFFPLVQYLVEAYRKKFARKKWRNLPGAHSTT